MLGLGKLDPIEQVYTKMNRLGSIAGIGRVAGQTATEYALTLGTQVPQLAAAAAQVSAGHSANTYGRRESTEQDDQELKDYWRTIRGGLIRQAFKRIVPVRENRVR